MFCRRQRRQRGQRHPRAQRTYSRCHRLLYENFRSLAITVAPRGDSKGSTDVGDFSHVVPTIQGYVGIGANAIHTVEFREAIISSKGDDAVVNGAKVMALTALDILSDLGVLDKVKEVFNARLSKKSEDSGCL